MRLNCLILSALQAATLILPAAHGHGVEVRKCITPSGYTRFFVAHWHGALSSASQAQTMTIDYTDINAGTTTRSNQYADGMFNDKPIYGSSPQYTGWGCINDATPELVNAGCSRTQCSSTTGCDDWVYYEYIAECNKPIKYDFISGDTYYLEDGCSGALYPASTGQITYVDESPPNPKVNGQELPLTIEVTTENVGDQSAAVTFTLTAEDDCDASPTVTSSIASGSSFPVGDTVITVTSTDNYGRTTTETLTITVIEKTRPPSEITPSPSDKPSMNPSFSSEPSEIPSLEPSLSVAPSESPSAYPSSKPSSQPSSNPSSSPSATPSLSTQPTELHSHAPSVSASPSVSPSSEPSSIPSSKPSLNPSSSPSATPSLSTQPTELHSNAPSVSASPSHTPSVEPSSIPSSQPSLNPSSSSSPSFSPSSQPSVSSQPTEMHSHAPSLSTAPSESPSSKPSLSSEPSESPSDSPSLSSVPSISSSPTMEGSFAPSVSLAPSDSPTNTHSTSPSLSTSPTDFPSSHPSEYPSSEPSPHPSSMPSVSPSDVPSSSPTIVEQVVTISGSLSTNQDFCAMGGAQKSAFVDASIESIRSFACPDVDDESCSATLTSACGPSARRSLSHRLLQTSSPWQIQYEVVNIFTCQTASCSSPSDQATVSSISNDVATTMSDAMTSGSFLSVLSTNLIQSSSFDASVATCLIVWGQTDEPELAVGGAAVNATGNFYPDWIGKSGTCLEDGNEPLYMSDNPTLWLSDSLESCCQRYYSGSNLNLCLNVRGSGLWYADPLSGKCVTDCDEGTGGTCGGLADIFLDKLYADPKSCCETELSWKFSEFCEAESFVASCYAGTGLYYRGDKAGSEVCVRDCDPSTNDPTCGGIVEEAYVKLHDTAEECCSIEYNWIDNGLCASRSQRANNTKYWADKNGRCYEDSLHLSENLDVQLYDSMQDCCAFGVPWLSERACLAASGVNIAELGSDKFYVDYVYQKCRQDCEGESPCGGIVQERNAVLYDSQEECCAKIWWVTQSDCLS